MSEKIDKVRNWIAWLRERFTPQAWKEVWEAVKALYELCYTLLYFLIYPFIEACKAFWNEVIKPFWAHVKVAWARLVCRAKKLWKEITDIFKKKGEEVPEEPVKETSTSPWD